MLYNNLFADVSSNNGLISIPHYSRAGHVLIAIKATQGTNYVNPYHLEQADLAHDFGLTVIHYHFCEDSAQREINHFRNISNKAWRKDDKVAFDIESGQSVGYANDILKKYYLETGIDPALYANQNELNTNLLGIKVPGEKVWVADYADIPFRNNRWAWQYTDGEYGPEPHFYSGVGKCDGSMIHRPEALRCYLRKIRTRRRK